MKTAEDSVWLLVTACLLGKQIILCAIKNDRHTLQPSSWKSTAPLQRTVSKRKRKKKKSPSPRSNQKQLKSSSIYIAVPATCMDAKHHLFWKAVVIKRDGANGTLTVALLWVLDCDKIYTWNCNNTPGVLFRMLFEGKTEYSASLYSTVQNRLERWRGSLSINSKIELWSQIIHKVSNTGLLSLIIAPWLSSVK